ncbi:hypothetical protein K0M31_014775 [Melipona bicolor]|uniref:Uncharacterized protein n=1 Tax=Melipona bicolor TaxID=60889 RepID=A0AA40FH03_9HYME|nr:hypothetical protein K0M31_014775 [Melipona bicolor]
MANKLPGEIGADSDHRESTVVSPRVRSKGSRWERDEQWPAERAVFHSATAMMMDSRDGGSEIGRGRARLRSHAANEKLIAQLRIADGDKSPIRCIGDHWPDVTTLGLVQRSTANNRGETVSFNRVSRRHPWNARRGSTPSTLSDATNRSATVLDHGCRRKS